ncbi:MAG TPA: hypothetical protein VMB47_06150 [Candidatus Aquilonibacter sp.]|nr:hypothetical protein [Candidatus Aquilonibacter sp.]
MDIATLISYKVSKPPMGQRWKEDQMAKKSAKSKKAAKPATMKAPK